MKKITVLICIVMMFLFTACGAKEVLVKENPSENAGEITELDCHVVSFECGYISYADILNGGNLLIFTKEELQAAKQNDCLIVSEEWWANNAIAEAFQKLTEEYPIEEYAYLIEYRETSCGGYYFHADKVGVTEDRIGFLLDRDEWPEPGQMVTEAMGGFCHMAAIPKEQIEGKTFVNVVKP